MTVFGKGDAVIGSAMAAGGGMGLTIQLLTDWGGLLAVGVNLALVFGGLYLLYLRLKVARRELRGKPR